MLYLDWVILAVLCVPFAKSISHFTMTSLFTPPEHAHANAGQAVQHGRSVTQTPIPDTLRNRINQGTFVHIAPGTWGCVGWVHGVPCDRTCMCRMLFRVCMYAMHRLRHRRKSPVSVRAAVVCPWYERCLLSTLCRPVPHPHVHTHTYVYTHSNIHTHTYTPTRTYPHTSTHPYPH